jgi:hypothetical protein
MLQNFFSSSLTSRENKLECLCLESSGKSNIWEWRCKLLMNEGTVQCSNWAVSSLASNIRLTTKNLSGANALAYFVVVSETEKKVLWHWHLAVIAFLSQNKTWFIGDWKNGAWLFSQLAILPTHHFVNLSFCQFGILSTCHFIIIILSTCNSVNFPFY